MYLILKRLTKARSGAAVGAMLFASQAVFAEIYWDFGTISELLAAFFSFAGLLLWMSERRDWTQVALASVLLFLAMKSKEMAVAMPLVWFSYDLLFAKDIDRKGIAQWILPGGLASLYGLAKASMMRGVVRADPYYMSVKGSTLASGFKIYLNMLFRTNFPWQIWCLGFLALVLLCLLLRSRLAFFFQLCVFITFLPVIFLINHRFAFYWYLPFLGVCGLMAMTANRIVARITARNPQWLVKSGTYSVFALLCWATFVVHKESNRRHRSWVRDRADEYRAFVTGLKALPTPANGEIMYFDSVPSKFDHLHLRSVTNVALDRTDIDARVVSEFPQSARYCLRFDGSRLTPVPLANREK